jgi:hypothetical protein
MILARFQVSGTTPATGLSFQAAVPKVKFIYVLSVFLCCLCSCFLVTTATDAAYVESEHQPRIDGDAADEGDSTCGGE